RDYKVTGVQTCALPIWTFVLGDLERATDRDRDDRGLVGTQSDDAAAGDADQVTEHGRIEAAGCLTAGLAGRRERLAGGRGRGGQIGRASCREGVERAGG